MAGIGIVTIIDDTAGDGSLVYVGQAFKGDASNTDVASFYIRLTQVTDGTTTTTAAASDKFDQVWDDRSSLTYS